MGQPESAGAKPVKMPIVSQAQRGLMYATAAGADTDVPKPVAREFVASDKPGKLPEHVKHAAGGGLGLGDSVGLGLGSPHLGFQSGGGLGIPMGMADPYWTRSEARMIQDQPFRGGLIPSSGAGRTDQLPLAVAADSHVIPAQEIAGLGQGNSLAGARILTEALRVGPYGTSLPQHFRGPGPPRPPGIPRGEYARGGNGHERETSILAAGGEFVIPKHDWVGEDELGRKWLHAGIDTLGEGDSAKGHAAANRMIMNIRKHTLNFLKSAPLPKK
jgi:hypothetical protein